MELVIFGILFIWLYAVIETHPMKKKEVPLTKDQIYFQQAAKWRSDADALVKRLNER